MANPHIVSFGEVLWDLFADGEQFGGAPANFACHAAILGANVSMSSAVGADRHGREALGILRDLGIDVNLVQTIPDVPTGTVSVQVDVAGKPTFTIHENSAWDLIAWSDQIETRVREADAVYFGTLGQRSDRSCQTIRRGVQTARNVGIPRIVDINLRSPYFDDDMIRESIQLASILKLSDDELPKVLSACGIPAGSPATEQLCRLLETFELDMAVMTCGAQGAVLANRDGIVRQEGVPTQVKDTVGAGDSFTAAFLMGVLLGQPQNEILHSACKVAAATCSHAGAVPRN